MLEEFKNYQIDATSIYGGAADSDIIIVDVDII
jgi:hypothetical protein